MSGTFAIRPARRDELAAIPRLECEADVTFRRVAMPWVLAMKPAGVGLLARAHRRGWLWVAANRANRAVGFALLATVDGEAYLHQLSVIPRAGRRGIGSALLEQACGAARAGGHATLLLSTYEGVAWNAPFYARHGFHRVPAGSYTRAMRDLRDTERRLGHPLWRRVLMRRTL